MSDIDKVMALTTCYKALEICHTQLQSYTASQSTPERVEVLHLLGTASILVKNFEQHFKLVGRLCYEHVYTLFVQMHRTTSHKYHPNYPTLSTDRETDTDFVYVPRFISAAVWKDMMSDIDKVMALTTCYKALQICHTQLQSLTASHSDKSTPERVEVLHLLGTASILVENKATKEGAKNQQKKEDGVKDWDLGKLPHATKEAEWVSHILQCNPILHEQATKKNMDGERESGSTEKWSEMCTPEHAENLSNDDSSEHYPINADAKTCGNMDGHINNMVHLPFSILHQRQILEYFNRISEPSVHVCLCFYNGKYRLQIEPCGTPSFSMEIEICSEILKQALVTQRTSTLKKVVAVIEDCITPSFIVFLQPHLIKNFYFQVIPYPPGVNQPEIPHQVQFSLCTGRKACIVGNPTISSRDDTFPDLPAATEEAKLLSELFESDKLIHEKATKEAVITRLRDARFVHMAAHCVKGEGLVLCDNTITAEDIERLEFQNEPPALVVLNCCDSAEGGMEGLALAFLKANVPTVIAIHGKIEDELAYEFTECFYSNMIKEGIVGTLSYYKAMMTMCNSSNSSVYVFYGKDIQFTS